MLFHSHAFLLLFLPIAWAIAVRLRKAQAMSAFAAWLLIASLFFYGWWDWRNLLLIGASVVVNFGLAAVIARTRSGALLGFGVALNLGLLAHFKYQAFFLGAVNAVGGTDFALGASVLPLGISFFTFQQIAYLVDVRRGEPLEPSLVRYALFVTFFPQLIAGPIVHLKELLPELDRPDTNQHISQDFAIGISIFAVGLFKKVWIADSLGPIANPVFDAAARGDSIAAIDAWRAALAYSGQLYFDFSGYSDMAIGLARLFGVRLPINFFSPYQASSVTDFWRRWHLTLSRFLRDYLYLPLGGNRRGRGRTYVNLLLTMLLGGLWHGANWTFVLWGALHGVLLALERLFGIGRNARFKWLRIALTFLVITLLWVLFRSASIDAAAHFYRSLAALPIGLLTLSDSWIALALLLAFLAPNTSELFAKFEPGLLPARLALRPTLFEFRLAPAHGVAIGLLLGVGVLGMARVTEFLYFQF